MYSWWIFVSWFVDYSHINIFIWKVFLLLRDIRPLDPSFWFLIKASSSHLICTAYCISWSFGLCNNDRLFSSILVVNSLSYWILLQCSSFHLYKKPTSVLLWGGINLFEIITSKCLSLLDGHSRNLQSKSKFYSWVSCNVLPRGIDGTIKLTVLLEGWELLLLRERETSQVINVWLIYITHMKSLWQR